MSMTVMIKDGRKSVYQGDVDRYLQLTDYAPATTVSFENSKGDSTFDVAIEEGGVAPIPNRLLDGGYEGIVKIYVSTKDYTLWEGVIEIRHRQLPGDYMLAPTKVTTWEEILEKMEADKTEAKNAMRSAKTSAEKAGDSAEKAEVSQKAVSDMETRITAMINALKSFEEKETAPTDDTKVLLVEGEQGRYIRYADLKSAILGTLSELNPEEIKNFMALTTEDLQQVENYLSGKGIHADTEMSFPQSDDKLLAIRGTEGKYITAGNLVEYVKTQSGNPTYAELKALVNSGNFFDVYECGQAINVDFTYGGTTYAFPFQVAHNAYRETVRPDGTTRQSVPLLATYLCPQTVQFSQYRAFLACPQGLAAGTYSITFAQAWSKLTSDMLTWSFTITKAVPAGGRIAGFRNFADGQSDKTVRVYGVGGVTIQETVTAVQGAADGATSLGTLGYTTRNGNLSSMQETFYGCNEYHTSTKKQWMNSDSAVGLWWSPQDEWDCAPDALTSYNGLLSYFDPDFVSILETVQVKTAKSTALGAASSAYDIDYLRCFLPSLEEMYITSQAPAGMEGAYLQLAKDYVGKDSPNGWYSSNANAGLIRYDITTKGANWFHLRSANRSSACVVWYVDAVGRVSSGGAWDASRVLPLVFI